jgi:hypothetical protein
MQKMADNAVNSLTAALIRSLPDLQFTEWIDIILATPSLRGEKAKICPVFFMNGPHSKQD